MIQRIEALAQSLTQSLDCNVARVITVSVIPTIFIAILTTLIVEHYMQNKGSANSTMAITEDKLQKSHRDHMTKMMDSLIDEITRTINFNTLLEAIEYLEDHANQIDLVLCATILDDTMQSDTAREYAFRWLLSAKLLWKHDANAIMFPWYAESSIRYGSPPRSRSSSA